MKKEMNLDLGCYNHKKRGYIGVDLIDYSNLYPQGEFVQHDLNTPLPFKNNSIDKIWIENILEQLNDFFLIGNEIYRVLKPNGIVEILVQHFSSSSAFSPSHHHFFKYNFTFTHPTKYNFGADRFEAMERRLIFNKGFKHPLGGVWEWLFNKCPRFWEDSFLRNRFPAWKLYVKLRAIKDGKNSFC